MIESEKYIIRELNGRKTLPSPESIPKLCLAVPEGVKNSLRVLVLCGQNASLTRNLK